MGYNTSAIIINDSFDEIANDPNFGKNLVSACLRVHSQGPIDVVAQKVYPSGARSTTSGATVLETHHADVTTLMAIGNNQGRKLAECYGDDNAALLKALAEGMGYRLVRKRAK